MQLYMVQHGEATSEEDNPDRPLTETGRADVARVAAAARRLGVKVDEIRHSESLRAIETAQIFEQELGAPRNQVGGLSPNEDINPLRREAVSRTESLMIVGHLPFLSHLAGALLAQDESMPVVEFRNGGLVRMDRHEGQFSVRWALPPEVLP